jgi:Rieske Fe-S protein
MIRTIKYSILALVIGTLVLLSWSCSKDSQEYNNIPNVAVNLQLDISSTMYIELSTIGGYVYLTGGYKGIVVYRISPEDFVAYDRACPYNPTLPCERITMDPSGITLTDSCCMSNFNILDGAVNKGPATQPLKRYHTQFDGQYLRIWN